MARTICRRHVCMVPDWTIKALLQVLQTSTGETLGTLRGHMDSVHACIFNPLSQELYTGGNDCQVLAWSPRQHDDRQDQDNWSDSE